MRAHQIVDRSSRRAFALAGKATFTLRSPSTGKWFTYHVESGRPLMRPIWFVSLLFTPASYAYLGFLGEDEAWRHGGSKSCARPDATSSRAFDWCWYRISRLRSLAGAEFWHEGSCGRCGRTLTVPGSLAAGLGPVCQGKSR